MSLVIQSINRPFSPANIYPSSFWLLCFIPTFITKTPTIHYQDTHYSLSTSPYLSLAINYHLKIKRIFLSHLTLLFSTQSRFRERRFIIHLKYFLQITPPTTRGTMFLQSGQDMASMCCPMKPRPSYISVSYPHSWHLNIFF